MMGWGRRSKVYLYDSVTDNGGNVKSNQREVRTFLINPRFQLKFIGVMILLSAIVIASTYFANSYFFWKFLQKGEGLHLPPEHIFFNFLKEQQDLMDRIFAIESVAILVVLFLVGLVFSHRIAGPLRKFQNHLARTAETGKWSKVHFRERDFFLELAEAYNQQIPGLRSGKDPKGLDRKVPEKKGRKR
jgi:hypothetical protein